MQYQLKNNKDFDGLAIHPFVLQEEKLYFGVNRKVSWQILERLEKSYNKLLKSGELNKIRNKEWW